MREPIEVFIEMRNGMIADARTSLANGRGIRLTVVHIDKDDSEREAAEGEALAAAALDRCPTPLDW
jgi:hypothetical protein